MRRPSSHFIPRAEAMLLALAFCLGFIGCSDQSRTVVVYTSQDQVYSEPLLRQFTDQTGIRVKAVYDSEAVKTVGLAQRLLAERAHPQCDVFWSNEELRMRQLAKQQLFANGWAAFGYRSRRIVINTNLLSIALAPQGLLELTNARWTGKIALAYPLFGTTATHLLALRQSWGPAPWEAWCRALAANRPRLVDGNSVVVQLIGRGEAWIGLTDWDDIAAGRRAGWPLATLPMTPETLLIPNTAAVIRQAPHPQTARRLYEWLQRPAVVQQLVDAQALEGTAPAGLSAPVMQPDWNALLRDLEPATAFLKEVFLR